MAGPEPVEPGICFHILDGLLGWKGIETVLKLNVNCWKLDPSITADPSLNWDERFGYGEGWDGMNKLRIRFIPENLKSLFEFERGKIDIVDVTTFPEKRVCYETEPSIEFQSDIANNFGLFGYNINEDRDYIGSRTPCPGDPSISVGLAIRKAISYAMNRAELNKIIHGGEYDIVYHPIGSTMGIWCNPNIIRYNHDLDKAREYMTKAGFDLGWTPAIDIHLVSVICGITILFAVATLFVKTRKRRNLKI